jgi:hypothetical protein
MTFDQLMRMEFGAKFTAGGRCYHHLSGAHYPVREDDGIVRLWVMERDSGIVRAIFVRPDAVVATN